MKSQRLTHLEHRGKEINLSNTTLTANGFRKKKTIISAFKSNNKPKIKTDEQQNNTMLAILPYVKGITDHIK